MKRLTTIILILIYGLFVRAQNTDKLVDGNNKFAIELYKSIYNKTDNILFSPYSISSAMAIAYAGASGSTEKQFSKVMHFDLVQSNTHQGFSDINQIMNNYSRDSIVVLNIANALWHKSVIDKQYLNEIKKYYKTPIMHLSNAMKVNAWIEKATNNKIKGLITPEDVSNSVLIITNAVYFNAKWEKIFEPKATKKDTFFIAPKNRIFVPMMFKNDKCKYTEDSRNQVITIPYAGNVVSMIIILPKKKSSIDQLKDSISVEMLNKYINQSTYRDILLFLPKFRVENTLELSKTLAEMGMPEAFSSKANFSKMADVLWISAIKHKTYIDVDERGTEAAAATAISMVKSARPDKKVTFKANRPFMYLIIDNKTRSILFMGSLMSPKAN